MPNTTPGQALAGLAIAHVIIVGGVVAALACTTDTPWWGLALIAWGLSIVISVRAKSAGLV